MTKNRTSASRKIARERIDILLNLAKKVLPHEPELSRRYVRLSKRIGMRTRVRIPRERKIFICKSCDVLLVPGINCRVRTRSDKGTALIITCTWCGAKKVFPIVREKASRRRSSIGTDMILQSTTQENQLSSLGQTSPRNS